MPLLWKISIFNRKVNIRLGLYDDNYQHVRVFLWFLHYHNKSVLSILVELQELKMHNIPTSYR